MSDAVPTEAINPGELVRWTDEDGRSFVGILAGNLGETMNCVEADGTPHPGIPRERVGRR